MNSRFIRKSLYPEFSVAALFILLGSIGISHHEMWLDELHHWLLARDSSSLTSLFKNARYDVHPLLWDFLLFILSRFTHDPSYMQLLNLLISSVAAYLFLRHAPFSFAVRALIIFGYFFFYEYTVISRNYSSGMLLMACCCILFRNRKDHYVLLSLSCGLLANTHLFALFVSFSFFVAMVVDYCLHAEVTRVQKRSALYGVLIYSALFFLAWIQILPPSDYSFTVPQYDFSWQHIDDTLSILTKSFIPLPDFRMLNWWNTNFITNQIQIPFNLLPLLILLTPFFIFFRNPAALIIFYLSTFSTLLFIFISQVVAVRYDGFIYLSLIAALWINEDPAEMPFRKRRSIMPFMQGILKTGFLYAVMILQLIAGSIAWLLDYGRPFSQAHSAVTYLIENNYGNEPVAVGNCDTGVPISGYLHQKVFYCGPNEWGSFCNWQKAADQVTADTLLSRIMRMTPRNNSILILNDSLFNNHLFSEKKYPEKEATATVRFLTKFTGSTVRSENYFIYHVGSEPNEP